MIHPTAIVHPKAELHPSVRVGPYAVIDENVVVQAGCHIGPYVYLTGRTILGQDNALHAGCVIGDAPQDLKYRGELTGVRIGDKNVFREHVTVHRSNTPAEDTIVGSGNFLMAHSHVGHNSLLEDQVILANGALLGGHVRVESRAFISGNCLVHQFIRVGFLAFMQGGSSISKDLPPFTMARGCNRICGLNTIGLRRAGLSSAERLELRGLYHFLFRARQSLGIAVEKARSTYLSAHAQRLINFVAAAQRGVCADGNQGRAGVKDDETSADREAQERVE